MYLFLIKYNLKIFAHHKYMISFDIFIVGWLLNALRYCACANILEGNPPPKSIRFYLNKVYSFSSTKKRFNYHSCNNCILKLSQLPHKIFINSIRSQCKQYDSVAVPFHQMERQLKPSLWSPTNGRTPSISVICNDNWHHQQNWTLQRHIWPSDCYHITLQMTSQSNKRRRAYSHRCIFQGKSLCTFLVARVFLPEAPCVVRAMRSWRCRPLRL